MTEEQKLYYSRILEENVSFNGGKMKRKFVMKAKGNTGRSVKMTVELDSPKGNLTKEQSAQRESEYAVDLLTYLVHVRGFDVQDVKVVK
jgi:hypothetical protein